MTLFVFFSNSIASPVPPFLVCSTCLTSLLNMFWAIQQGLFFMSTIRKICQIPKTKENVIDLFCKVVGLQHPNLLKWSPTVGVFLGITEIIFWWIFHNIYHMKSLQISDKFCSNLLVIFLNMAYTFASRKKRRDISSFFHFLLSWLS